MGQHHNPERGRRVIVLALDYGERRIGAAVCDELEIAAHPLPNVERDGTEWEQIAELMRERKVDRIVVGMPIRMDGTEGRQARKVRGFVKELRHELPDVEIETMDERLTSAEAHRALSQMGASNRQRRRAVDSMAAQIILRRYMERRRSEEDS